MMSAKRKIRVKIDEDELSERLAAMGYENVPPELLAAMKRDLKKLVKHDLKLGKPLDREITPVESSTLSTSSSSSPAAPPVRRRAKSKPRVEMRAVQTEPILYPSSHESDHLNASASSYASSTASSNRTTASEALVRAQLSSLAPVEWPRSCCANISDGETDVRSRSRRMARCSSAPASGRSVEKKPKKHDPVSLYHTYKKEWDKFTVPGSDPRVELRRQIRAKFM